METIDMQSDLGRFRGFAEACTYSGYGGSSGSRDVPCRHQCECEDFADKCLYDHSLSAQCAATEEHAEESQAGFDHIDTDDELFFPRFENSRSLHPWSSSATKPRVVEANATCGLPEQMRVPQLGFMQVQACHSGASMIPYSTLPYSSSSAHHHLDLRQEPAVMLDQCAYAQCSQAFMGPSSSPSVGSLGICPATAAQWSPCEAWPHTLELRDLYGPYDDWSHSERLDFDDDSDQSDLMSEVSDSDASTFSNVSEGNLAIDCPDAICAEGCVVFCSICLDDCTSGERIRTVAICGHQFHADCLETWLERRGRCPNCRRSVSSHVFDVD
mmetsp:Transcript_91506/g.144582  ORF Transcript_91506/g.144582 Transcript_91506/m.144582 type:complete len:328 (-) Transcript_91506:326-1309(-)